MDLPALLCALYEAASEPTMWKTALERMSDALDGASFVFGFRDGDGPVFAGTARLDPEREARLLGEYQADDAIAAMPLLPVMAPVPRRQIIGDEDYARSDLFNDIFRPESLTHEFATCFARRNGTMITSALLRRTDREFVSEHAQLFEALLPHLRRAIALTARTLELAASRRHAAADAGPDGLAAVDAEGRLLYANARAVRILEVGDALAGRDGRVAAAAGPVRERLALLIRMAAGPAAGKPRSR